MTHPSQPDHDGRTGPDRENVTPSERQFLSSLLDDLAETDPAMHEMLVETNPDLLDLGDLQADLRERLRESLLALVSEDTPADQRRFVAQIQARLLRRRMEEEEAPAADKDPTGIITSLTRQITPEQALALYHDIAPRLVHEVMSYLGHSANLGTVRRAADHLLAEDVQARLRECEHVRDGILEELQAVLEPGDRSRYPTRSELMELMRRSGAERHLVAMANCLTLAGSRAG